MKKNLIKLLLIFGLSPWGNSAILRVAEPIEFHDWDESTVVSYAQTKISPFEGHRGSVSGLNLSFVNFHINEFFSPVESFSPVYGTWGFSESSSHEIVVFVLKDNYSNSGWIFYNTDLSVFKLNDIHDWYSKNNNDFSLNLKTDHNQF